MQQVTNFHRQSFVFAFLDVSDIYDAIRNSLEMQP